jgi:uncharacterized protein (DUF486 family)
MKRIAVPLLLIASSCLMALAWLGHLRFEATWSFWLALAVSWSLVIPEYVLNTAATRWGYGTYTGAQMASMNLSSGVVAVALVSMLVLGEELGVRQAVGFVLMLVSMVLILGRARPVG